MKIKRQTMRRQRRRLKTRPPSAQKPSLNLGPRDVAALPKELESYHQLFCGLFLRSEQRIWSEFYLRGQVSDLKRKTIEPMVLDRLGADPNAVRAVQQFIGAGAWDDQRILQRLRELVGQVLGQRDGVVIVDGSGFPKQGDDSVGVAWQYCGLLGKLANCQEGVFLVYASLHGYTFLDCRLYMPEDWFDKAHAKRRRKCGVPTSVEQRGVRTEPQLALEMLRALVREGTVPFRWVTCDEHFGRDSGFLDSVAALPAWYMAEVPVSTRAWERTPRVQPPGKGPTGRPRTRPRVSLNAEAPQALCDLAADLPRSRWHAYVIKEGSKGPIRAEFAFLRVTPVRGRSQHLLLPGARMWAVFRRSLDPQPELKTFLSNAPVTCSHVELVRLSGWRWPIESALEEGKGVVGMDDYETRTWRGWHHHMTQSFLAHFFLVRLRIRLKKSPGDDHRAGAPVGGQGPRAYRFDLDRDDWRHAVPPATKPCSLSVTSQARAPTATRIAALET